MSGDGQTVIARDQNDDIVMGRVGEDASAEGLLVDEEFLRSPALSPDGRWLAYTSNESGEVEIYVRPFPNVGDGQWQISNGGGAEPLWARDSQELFYKNGVELVSVTYATEPSFRREREVVLFTLPPGSTFFNVVTYDVSPDGQRFLMYAFPDAFGESSGPELIVVENFFEELKAKVGN